MVVESAPLQIVSSNPGYLRAKRVLDIVFTLLILLPLVLVIAIVALVIRLDSEGPIFFRQKRIGANGEEFTMFKFRSMHVDSNDAIHRQAVERYMQGEILNREDQPGSLYKLSADPRITRVGRFIRRTSIDELPQFFNVLRGEMSLVGPRPPLLYEVDLYSSHDWLRLSGKPGLTGTWQVYARSQVSFQEMVEMDIVYLEQQSLWLDMKLILLTPAIMVSGRGGA
ncbi:MAG TPA: sugar transferase [Ktedonobacteraceae bacterium]|nr:sugar transferase [Ktedonobacteraceae bacterium]